MNYSNQAAMGDFEYELTEEGQKRAHWHAERCTYCGAAPVPLEDYIASVEQQSIRKARPKLPDLCKAFGDLLAPARRRSARSARPSMPAAACSCMASRATARRASPSGVIRAVSQTSGFRARSR